MIVSRYGMFRHSCTFPNTWELFVGREVRAIITELDDRTEECEIEWWLNHKGGRHCVESAFGVSNAQKLAAHRCGVIL